MVMQIVDDSEGTVADVKTVMPHPTGFDIPEAAVDSTEAKGEGAAAAAGV